jgi:hypothetical protein
MSIKVLWGVLKPKFNTMKPDSKFGTFHTHVADALTFWFTSYFLPKQIFKANGIQYIPPTTEIMMSEFNLPPNPLIPFKFTVEKIVFTQGEIIRAFQQQQSSWATLFELIGTKISSLLMTLKYVTLVPDNKIVGFLPTPFITAHFRTQGYKFFTALQAMNFSADALKSGDATALVWNTFESYLIEAINTIPPVLVDVAGKLTPGTFTGKINAKLSI